MSKVSITRSLLDDLAMSISAKSGESVPLTLTEMKDAVDSISGGGTTIDALSVTANGTYTAQSGHAYSPVTVNVPTPSLQSKTYNVSSAGTATITADSGYDGLSSVAVSVPSASFQTNIADMGFSTINGVREWHAIAQTVVDPSEGDIEGWIATGNYDGNTQVFTAVPSNTTITPIEYPQSIGGYEYMMEGAVTVNAIPSNYVGSGITRRSSTDLYGFYEDGSYWIGGDTGYFANDFEMAVPNGTAGTPTATKGTVSNHSISVTPSVTNTSGYITGSTKTGTAVTVSASELVSGTLTISSSGIKDVTNYASASVAAGTEGTPTATKGTVSNHSISVTPKVTNSAGYIAGSTKTGTAVTVSASELVNGNLPITQNGNNIDCANYSTVSVNVSGSSKNTQVVQSTTRTSASTLTAIGAELTVSKTGTYDIYYSCFRTNTSASYTWATRLYINGTAYGTAEDTTWTNNQQNTHLSNISLTTGDKLRVYGRNTRGTSYYVCAPMLVIIEA